MHMIGMPWGKRLVVDVDDRLLPHVEPDHLGVLEHFLSMLTYFFE